MKLSIFILSSFLVIQAQAAVRVATYNIRNFDYDQRSNTPTNKNHLSKILKEINFDILAVQEINKRSIFASMIDENFGSRYQTYLSECGGAHEQHLGFVVDGSKFDVIKFEEDMRTANVNAPEHQQYSECYTGSRPLAVIKLQYKKSKIKIAAIAVHLKSGGRQNNIKKRFKQIKKIMELKSELKAIGYSQVMIMGDFNTTEFINQTRSMKDQFQRQLVNSELVNQTQDLTCTAYWWGQRDDNYNYPSHLDHIITSDVLRTSGAPKVYGHCKILKCAQAHESQMQISFDEVSDHCPISIEVDL